MNKLTEEFHELLRPKAALIAYHCMQPDQKYYLETRPISEDGKMGEGHVGFPLELCNKLIPDLLHFFNWDEVTKRQRFYLPSFAFGFIASNN